jgi:uncharacterized protein
MNDILQEKLKQAMKERDTNSLNVLRSLKTALTNALIQRGNSSMQLNEMESFAIVRKQIAQREDSIKHFINANREELAHKEMQEIEILKEFLPPELSDEEMDSAIDTVINNIINTQGSISRKDMGIIMKNVNILLKGLADNRKISQKLNQKLG